MKVIIFDIDDTLIEWKKEFIFALKNVLKKMNYNFSDEMINKINKCIDENELCHTKLIKEQLLSYINENCNINLPIKFIENLIEEQKNCVYEDKNLIKTIEYLSKKYELYIVTNWFTETQTARLEKMGILKYFKKVYGADINYFKPDKRSFNVITKSHLPKECISIGDSLENDIVLPISLGMKALWKTDSKSDKYNTFKNIGDLINIL